MPRYGVSDVQQNRRIRLTNGKYITRERSGSEVGWLSSGNKGPMPIWTEDLDKIAIDMANAGLSKMGLPPVECGEIYPSRELQREAS